MLKLHDQTFEFLVSKGLYWKEQNALLLADTHFGKGTHFRKHGIYISKKAFENDLLTLQKLLDQYKPSTLYILGDMFHSHFNEECDAFANLMHSYKTVKTMLIKGNHDILHEDHYKQLNIHVQNTMIINKIHLVHEALQLPKEKSKKKNQPNSQIIVDEPVEIKIGGHIHPAYSITGKGNQSITLPCFYLTKHALTLPSFGSFTGHYNIKPESTDKVFVISGEKVVEVNLH